MELQPNNKRSLHAASGIEQNIQWDRQDIDKTDLEKDVRVIYFWRCVCLKADSKDSKLCKMYYDRARVCVCVCVCGSKCNRKRDANTLEYWGVGEEILGLFLWIVRRAFERPLEKAGLACRGSLWNTPGHQQFEPHWIKTGVTMLNRLKAEMMRLRYFTSLYCTSIYLLRFYARLPLRRRWQHKRQHIFKVFAICLRMVLSPVQFVNGKYWPCTYIATCHAFSLFARLGLT